MSYKAPGFSSATPYLCIEGAAAALAFYKQAFGAVETHMDTTGDGQIRHAEFRIGDSMFMLSDYKPEFSFLASTQQNRAPGISIFLYVPDADAVFQSALAAGATQVMPMEDKPYGRTGGVQDPFGILWWPTTHPQ